MPAIIHCVRHAQGFHNLGFQYHDMPDPKLTPLGEEQCLKLKERFGDQSNISLVTASPLSRTLHTAFVGFTPALQNGKTDGRIFAIPDAQETSSLKCDMGSDVEVLNKICETNSWPTDLSLVVEGWNNKDVRGRYSPASLAVKARARDTRRFLRQKAKELEAAGDQNPEIVLVAHGGYLHYFTDDWEHSNKYHGTGWKNCEFRSFVFENDNSDPDARIIETMESRKNRGLDYPTHSKDKQEELFQKSMQNWEGEGFVNASKIGWIETNTRGEDQTESKL